MLDIFPDQKALTPKEKPKEDSIEPRTEESTATVVSKSGGFPFQVGEKFDAPPPAYDSSKGGFPFAFGSNSSSKNAEVTSSTSASTTATESTSTTSTPLSLGSISTTSTGNTITTTSSVPDLVSKVVTKPATVTFNLSSQPAEVTKPQGGLPIPTFTLPVTSELPTSTSDVAPTTISFGLTKPTQPTEVNKESEKKF